MSLRNRFQKLESVFTPKVKLEIKIIRTLDEITNVDEAIWVLFNI